MMAAGHIRIGEAFERIARGDGDRAVAHATAGPVLQQNLVASWRGSEQWRSKERTAVIGVGQTKYAATRGDVSMAGLLREAAHRALEMAGKTWDDIDAVVIGKAPDFFEGVMMPELYLAEALGCVGKPMLRVHTAGSVGGSTACVAASMVQSRVHETVLTVAWEKQSESNAMWALSLPLPFTTSVNAGAGGYFAPLIRRYMAMSDAPEHIGCMVAFKDRQNALKNPYAHLHQPDLTFEQVVESPMLWDPIRYSETCPSSDGACAMVFTDEAGGDAHDGPGVDPGHGDALGAELLRRPQQGVAEGQRGLRRRRVRPGRHPRSPQGDRRRRDVRAVLLVRAHVARDPRVRREG